MKQLAIAAMLVMTLSCVSSSTYIQRDPVFRETEIRQARPRVAGEVFDRQEEDPELTSVFAEVDKKAERAVGDVPRNERFIFRFWEVKKQILREEHGISWESPAELNPGIAYGSYGQPPITEDEYTSVIAQVRNHMVSSSEEVGGAWRTFEGAVLVSTSDGDSGIVRHYELHGHGQSWEFISVGVVEE